MVCGNIPSKNPLLLLNRLLFGTLIAVKTLLGRSSSVVERRTENPCVASSILAFGTT